MEDNTLIIILLLIISLVLFYIAYVLLRIWLEIEVRGYSNKPINNESNSLLSNILHELASTKKELKFFKEQHYRAEELKRSRK